MSTNTKPEYTFSVDSEGVDIRWQDQTLTIEAEDLRLAGWQHKPTCERDHCGDGDCAPCMTCDERDTEDDRRLTQAVEQWHNAEHESVLRFCDHPVCVAMGHVMGVRFG